MSAARCASSVRPAELRKYTCDEVAHWLCEVGFRDYTAGFLERNVTGQKLLDMQRFQINSYFPRDADRGNQFWNLLEAIRNNTQLTPCGNRIGRPTPPPPVPRGSFPPAPLPGRHRRPLPPPGPTSNKGYIDNPEEDYIQNISSRPSPFSHPPIGVSPFSNVHPMSRMPPLSDMPPALPHHKPSPAELKKKKHTPSYDDHALPSRPPPQPPRPQERTPSSRSDGHSPVTSRPPSVKDMPPFHSHIPDRKHNRSTDSASSTSSDDLAMVPRPMVATSQSMPFNKPSKMPTRFPPTNRGAPNHTTAMMPPLEIVAPSKPAANTDLSKPTEDQPWFMNTGRDGAQRAIEGNKQNGIFVVRPKHESNYQPYALTLWASGTFKNLVIRRKPDGEFALGREKAGELSFKTVVAMIDYYQKHELNIADSSAITLISGP